MTNHDPRDLPDALLNFLAERHLATLTIVKADQTPHVTPVGVTYQPEAALARVITWADSWKAKHVSSLGTAAVALCTVDGGRWITISGTASLTRDPAAVAEAVRRYTERYRPPKARDDRVVIEIDVTRVIGRA